VFVLFDFLSWKDRFGKGVAASAGLFWIGKEKARRSQGTTRLEE